MSTSTDYARWAEKKRAKDMSRDSTPDAYGTRIADFICMVVLCLWLLDMACWGAK